MFTRKLVKSGESSHVVSLPKDFLDENKLAAGDIVRIERQGVRELLISADISAKPKPQQSVQVIRCQRRPIRHILRDIVEAYINNVQEIIIHYESTQQVMPIKDSIAGLVALEIIQEDSDKIVARDFLNIKSHDIDKTVQRIGHIVHSMLLDLSQVPKDEQMSQIILQRDKEVNRLGFLVLKLLRVASLDPQTAADLKLSSSDIIYWWMTITALEKIGDEVKRMGLILHSLTRKKGNTRELLSLVSQCGELFKNTKAIIHKLDRDLMDENLDHRHKLIETISEFTQKQHPSEMISFCGNLLEMISHLADINRMRRHSTI